MEALDAFFRSQAGQNQRRDASRTWVLPRPEGTSELPPILGYYTLSLGTLERETLPPEVGKRLPRYPIPVIILGRLAVDLRARGRGYGARLLDDAHLRALAINAQGGGLAVVVDAKDEAAERFYRHYQYEPLVQQRAGLPWPRRLLLPIATIRASMTEPTDE